MQILKACISLLKYISYIVLKINTLIKQNIKIKTDKPKEYL